LGALTEDDLKRIIMAAAILVSTHSAAWAAGHYCDGVADSEWQDCMSAKVRSDDDCTRIASDTERLQCWDRQRAAQDCKNKWKRPDGQSEEACLANLEPTKDTVETALATPWLVEEKTSDFTDQRNIFLSTFSMERANCGSRGDFATLYLRCVENKTSLFVFHGCYTPTITRNTWSVDVRIDDAPMKTVHFNGSASNNALGYWTFRQAKPFIESLFGAAKLRMRFRDYSGNTSELTFPIHELETAILPLRETCGW